MVEARQGGSELDFADAEQSLVASTRHLKPAPCRRPQKALRP